MKKGFTLIEVLIVVIILGILATLAIPRFGALTEKARVGEASVNMAAIATAERVYQLETGNFLTVADLSVANNLPVTINAKYWGFGVVAAVGPPATFTITATRNNLGLGGAAAQGQRFTLNQDGVWADGVPNYPYRPQNPT